jgi:tripartite-type tricarboxylate transporter receptor subunit TctC
MRLFSAGISRHALVAVLATGAAVHAHAQTTAEYPVKPVRIVVVYGAGAGSTW